MRLGPAPRAACAVLLVTCLVLAGRWRRRRAAAGPSRTATADRLARVRRRVPVRHADACRSTLRRPRADDRPGGDPRSRRATPRHRIGTLVFNPGGPGVAGRVLPRGIASTHCPAALRDRFDLVGFDPRGVGAQQPDRVRGHARSGSSTSRSSPRPTPARTGARRRGDRRSRRQCAARNGDLLAHVSTADAVRDLEQLRVALGEDRLSFVGYSYGTFLGASYADAYPEHVRAFVLDGPVDPSTSARAGDARRRRAASSARSTTSSPTARPPGLRVPPRR